MTAPETVIALREEIVRLRADVERLEGVVRPFAVSEAMLTRMGHMTGDELHTWVNSDGEWTLRASDLRAARRALNNEPEGG